MTQYHRYFDPLADRHGLRCISSTPEIVRFANEKVFFQVRFGAIWSFEVGLEIGEVPASANQPERAFNLAEVLRLQALPDAAYVERLQVNKLDLLAGAIERLSVLAEKYAFCFLDGVAEDFVRLAKFRDKECSEYALSRDLRYAREDAERALENKK